MFRVLVKFKCIQCSWLDSFHSGTIKMTIHSTGITVIANSFVHERIVLFSLFTKNKTNKCHWP